MASWLRWTVLIALTWLALYCYNQYVLHQRDIHEIALNQQANISTSRKETETAVYRNNQTPHGMPLLTGLSIRNGFRLRNGNLRDIWSVVMGQKAKDSRLTFLSQDGTMVCDLDNLSAVFKRLALYFSTNECQKIGIAVPVYTYHGFVSTMACWMHGLTVFTFNKLPRSQYDIDLLIVDEAQLKFALMFNYKRILVVSTDKDKTYDVANVSNWGELGELEMLRDEAFDYSYDPSYDDILPLMDVHDFKCTSYTQQNFVSAVATTIKSLPLGYELGRDRILIGYGDSTINYWPKVLSGLLCGGSVCLGTTKDIIFEDAIITYHPTILCLDADFAEKYTLPKIPQGWIYSLKLHRAMHLLSQGVFSHNASSKDFEDLRLIYIGDQERRSLSSELLTTIRAFCGSRLICERYKSGIIGPVLSTNYYDYRIFTNNSLTNRGTSPLSLETKLCQYKNLDISKRHGELCVRGFTIGKPFGKTELENAIKEGERVGSEGWMPTGIIGKIGIDGCFYEDV